MKPEYVIALALVVQTVLILLFNLWRELRFQKQSSDVTHKLRTDMHEIMCAWSKATIALLKASGEKK